ncbi:MAG: carbamoyltransferase C-terminal domain-containing protein [Leucobacter sp.]
MEQVDIVVNCTAEPPTAQGNRLEKNLQLTSAHQRERTYSITHHLGHAMSAFCTSGFDGCAVLVIDGLGSHWQDFSDPEKHTSVGATKGRESVSIYHATGTRMEPVEKQLCVDMWVEPDGSPFQWEKQITAMPHFRTLGGMYSAVGWQLFAHGLEGPGKLMSLAGLGSPNHSIEDFLSIDTAGIVQFNDVVPRRYRHDEHWPSHRDEYIALSASVQAALEHAVIHLARRALSLTGSQRLCFVGGTALNGIVNEILCREFSSENVFIFPAAEDSGTAVGAAYHGLWKLGIAHEVAQIQHDFHGKPYGDLDVLDAEKCNEIIKVSRVSDTAINAAESIDSGGIVGWFQHGSELGPRALGHRSILADPRNAENKRLLNLRLKQREDFRPFAPAVLEEHAHKWFEMEAADRSPFMLRVTRVRTEVADLIPAVLHDDGTARVQTVSREHNPDLYRVIEAFWHRTGIPILLNTSMNGRGEPIVERVEQAFQLAVTAPLDAVYINDYWKAVPRETVFESLIPVRVECLGVKPRHPEQELSSPEGVSGDRIPTEYLELSKQHVYVVPTLWGPYECRLDDKAASVFASIDDTLTVGEMGNPDILRSLQRMGMLRFTSPVGG